MGRYDVVFDPFAGKHFIKDFRKKYKKRWDITKEAISFALTALSNLEGRGVLDKIGPSCLGTIIAKYDFKVDKDDKSPKTSGNRCILDISNDSMTVRVLLVYGKHNIDLPEGQETKWWKDIIEKEFGLFLV